MDTKREKDGERTAMRKHALDVIGGELIVWQAGLPLQRLDGRHLHSAVRKQYRGEEKEEISQP